MALAKTDNNIKYFIPVVKRQAIYKTTTARSHRMARPMVNQEPADLPETKAATPTEARTMAQLRMSSAATNSRRGERAEQEGG
ncbi:MAG: hypothetical protein V1800_02455 [Candidatus Latescibacterota bacterium]